MKNLYPGLLPLIFSLLFTVNHFSQDLSEQEFRYPAGISVEYGIGGLAVTDEYISKEKYSGSIPYYNIGWRKQHADYVYHLNVDFHYSSRIKNYNVSTDIYQFAINQGFDYKLTEFTIFDKNTSVYLGPTAELYFYFNRQNIAVSGFDYAQSFSLLISGGINSELFYELWKKVKLEGSLSFSLLSLGFRMVDEEETDEKPAKILTLFSGTNLVFKFGPRYYLLENLSVKAAYLFHFTRISSWEPLLSASDNVVLSFTYGF